MPRYTYQCEDCLKTFDAVRSISEREEPTEHPCEGCGEKSLRKVITPIQGFRPDVQKNSPEFKEVMDNIKKEHPLNTIPTY